MSLTLAEAAKLSNDILLKGVIETVIKESPVLQRIPVIEIQGNGLTYNRENALPSVAFYDVGDTWAESSPTFTQVTAVLKILGGDADVDNYVRSTRQNIQDIEAAVIELKAKALRHAWEENFIYGDSAVNSKQFDGLKKTIDTATASAQVIAMSADGATLTLEKLDEVIDAVKGGKPDMLLMSRRSRRKLNQLMRALGSMSIEKDAFGQFVSLYNGIPCYVSDWILDTHTVASSLETATTGAVCSTIYAFQLGEGALAAISGPGTIQAERIGALETKDATRTRVKWYTSLVLFSTKKAAALIGVED